MKTLKKTLCLVLALVMVVGTLAFAASADVAKPVDNFANYKDAETAKASAYAEAIDVNLGLGIIKGVSKTEIKIDGTLTRAQAAKIVCYLLLGEDIAEKLAPASSFDDVAETMWASKYIAYAASEGILNGKGNNKFDPNGEVTGYEFEKILLNALDFGFTNIQNYDPITGDVIPGKKNNYTGSNWKINVAKDAYEHMLGEGAYGYGTALEGVDLNKALTRAEAMELVFDALIIDMFEGIDNLEYYFEPNHTELTDGYGRPLIVWAADDKNISGSYLYPSTFTLTFVDVDVAGQTAEDAIDAYNKENGTKYAYGAAAGDNFRRGETVEFYVVDNEVVYYVDYCYALDKITKVNDDGTVESAYGYYDTWDPDHPVVIEGAKKDDIYRIPYSYTLHDYVVEDAEKVEPDFTSKITAYANHGYDVTANGAVQYVDKWYNWAIGAELDGLSYGDFKNEFDFYLSPVGTVLAAIQVTEVSTEPDYLYGFAIAYQVKSATSSTTTTDLFGSQTTGTDAPAMAKIVVVTPDAETKILDLAVRTKDSKFYVAGKFLSDSQTSAKEDYVASDLEIVKGEGNKSIKKDLSNPVFVKYFEKEDGTIVIADTAALSAGADYAAASIEFNGVHANSNTALKVVTANVDSKGNVTYSAESKTGYKNFPEFKAADGYQFFADTDNNVIYVWGSAAVPTPDVIHVPAYIKAVGELVAEGYKVTAIVGGKDKTYYAQTETTVLPGHFYMDLDSALTDGQLKAGDPTEWTAVATVLENIEITGVDANYFTYAGGDVEYPSDTAIYDLTGKGLTALDKGYKAYVFGTTNTDAVASNKSLVIFITEVPKA